MIDLVPDPLLQLYLCSPFVCWGIMMIAINAAGHAKLDDVNNPIALFNIVHTVYMKYYRGLGLAIVGSMSKGQFRMK